MEATKLSIKLLIDNKTRKVLFAEAGKDLVDFLFSLLSLPVGCVIRVLTKDKMVGCIGNLYDSVELLSDTYILYPDRNKDILLKPKTSVTSLLIPKEDSTPKIYMCGSYHRYVTDDPRAICPQCKYTISTQVPYVGPPESDSAASSSDGGYVKGVVTYMVMDNLVVTPMSTISSITVLNKFNVENVKSLEEKTVQVGMDEGLELLKASLGSRTALSDVFLGKKAV